MQKTTPNPLISVIIPSFNTNKDDIFRCINSIINQTYKNLEILIVDDGSKQEYKEILNEVSKLDNRIEIMSNKENKGEFYTRNYGVSLAKGEFIVFADADDEVLPYFIEEAFSYQKLNNADITIGSNIMIKENGIVKEINDDNPKVYLFDKNNKNELKTQYVHYWEKNNKYSFGRGTCCRLVKSSIAKKVLFDEEFKIGGDIKWNLDILGLCENVCVVERKWYVYYQNSYSVVHKYDENRYKKVEYLVKQVEKYIDKSNKNELFAYYSLILEHTVSTFRNICLSGHNDKKTKRILYHEEPWTLIKNFEFIKAITFPQKVWAIGYIFHVLKPLIFVKEKIKNK